ncbi:ROK family protein [Oscillochloris trichoides DG-6]|uniref:ROK family protein n=1 Tax=Oscillochloris trichoides DG-6 TaxID=765420 RepID=E1IEH4_9CHLR|nr:ROK family protein [Oscillochloris trichoides]EFO80500.1 ROK family protein [Oscillochloris trichoides DG-6]
MAIAPSVYIGTDFGATTSKIAGIWVDGQPISTELLQRPSNSHLGPAAVVEGWIEAIGIYLAQHDLSWDAVQGVGVAIPGPRRSYGVLERGPNLPESFVGFDVYSAYRTALVMQTGRDIPLVVGNDGNMGGVAEAHQVRGSGSASVLMLAPGSGLGCAFVDARGHALDGDTLAGMEASHMPAPLHLLGLPAYPCGCGREWGCIELYTSLAGLPYLIAAYLPEYPDHPLAHSPLSPKEQALSLRGLAQQDDPLAQRIFDFQARALGIHIANLAMACDPQIVIIGGGLMDTEATRAAFRERYLHTIWEAAAPYLWPSQRTTMRILPASLGELSQAIGAALVALDQHMMS